MVPRLDGKVAVVTGSSSGIGRSIAVAFASQGAKLVVCADVQPKCHDIAETVLGPVEMEDRSRPTHELIRRVHGEGTGVFVRCDVSLGLGEEGGPSDEAVHGGEEWTDKLRGVHVAIEEAVRAGGRLDM